MRHDDRGQTPLRMQFANHVKDRLSRLLIQVPVGSSARSNSGPPPAPAQSPPAAARRRKFHQPYGSAEDPIPPVQNLSAAASVSARGAPRINPGIIVFSSTVNSGKKMMKLKDKTYMPISKSCKFRAGSDSKIFCSIKPHRPARRPVQPAQQVQQRALARTRRTNDRDQAAPGQRSRFRSSKTTTREAGVHRSWSEPCASTRHRRSRRYS